MVTNNDEIDFIALFKKWGLWLAQLIKKTWTLLKRIHFGMPVFGWLGFVLLVISGIFAFVETVSSFLVLSDTAHFVQIFNAFFEIQLLDFVSMKHLSMMIGGGYLLDMTVWILVGLFGWFLWKKQNLFKHGEVFSSLLFILLMGLFLFMYGLYYAMPDIRTPLQLVYTTMEHAHHPFYNSIDDQYEVQLYEMQH